MNIEQSTLEALTITFCNFHYKAGTSLESICEDIRCNDYFGIDTETVVAIVETTFAFLDDKFK